MQFNASFNDHLQKALAGGLRFSLGTPVTSTNKTDRHDITDMLLKGTLNTITIPYPVQRDCFCGDGEI